MRKIPGFVIAGMASGVGKTSVTLGVIKLLSDRGLDVQSFKVGPDYLDPTYHTKILGRQCYNLDPWMSSPEHVKELFAEKTSPDSFAVIEGVMGLFDGKNVRGKNASTSNISRILGLPVILVINAASMSDSVAALVKGYTEFEPDIEIAGIIANFVGSTRHGELLADHLKKHNLPPLIGAIPKNSIESLDHRHLGLIPADEDSLIKDKVKNIAESLRQNIDIDFLCNLQTEMETPEITAPRSKSTAKIAVADDEAFNFKYCQNIEALEKEGAEIVRFSPLNDSKLPENISGIYLPGGYPEVFIDKLSANTEMISEIKEFAHQGKAIYAECGGLIYLSESLTDLAENEFEMCGVVPIRTRMLTKLKRLGYREVEIKENSLWGDEGTRICGHEYHYSEITKENLNKGEWRKIYLSRGRDIETEQGFYNGNILASYIHLYWAHDQNLCKNFINFCMRKNT
ncbi:MAG: cobyrinate a,c-diamide synthase [Planctomycetota bacterium]|jgi:cobyrinic acid a,c-diamide synthase